MRLSVQIALGDLAADLCHRQPLAVQAEADPHRATGIPYRGHDWLVLRNDGVVTEIKDLDLRLLLRAAIEVAEARSVDLHE